MYRFGCCSDGETPADGPEDEGCEERQDCKNYGPQNKYEGFGCCPDGKTLAQGPKNQGCFLNCPEEVFVFNDLVDSFIFGTKNIIEDKNKNGFNPAILLGFHLREL